MVAGYWMPPRLPLNPMNPCLQPEKPEKPEGSQTAPVPANAQPASLMHVHGTRMCAGGDAQQCMLLPRWSRMRRHDVWDCRTHCGLVSKDRVACSFLFK